MLDCGDLERSNLKAVRGLIYLIPDLQPSAPHRYSAFPNVAGTWTGGRYQYRLYTPFACESLGCPSDKDWDLHCLSVLLPSHNRARPLSAFSLPSGPALTCNAKTKVATTRNCT
jgi:hypothetical protein